MVRVLSLVMAVVGVLLGLLAWAGRGVKTPLTAHAPMTAVVDDALDTESNSPCTSFYRLESQVVTSPTRVEVGCLEIPPSTVIEVQAGTMLYVIATRGVRWGRSVAFNARGAPGNRGAPSQRTEAPWKFDGDVWHSRQGPPTTGCNCVNNDDWPELRGGKGGNGLKGGVLRFVMRNVRFDGAATLDARGGVAGAEGVSGRILCYCAHGLGEQFHSNVCPGRGSGAGGEKGRVDLFLAGARAAPVLADMEKAVVADPDHNPLNEHEVLESAPSFQQKVDELRDAALKGGFVLLPPRH